MSVASINLLLCLIIGILHANDALELAGAGRFYSQDLKIPLMDIEGIETSFIEAFNTISKNFEKKYANQNQECQNIFSNPAKYFSLWTESSKKPLLKLCSKRNDTSTLMKNKMKCVLRIQEYFDYYIRSFTFSQLNSCLNEKQLDQTDLNVSVLDNLNVSEDSIDNDF
ncbi:uncharacterized protein LOC122505859 [Leptopilina heterotoma]|uniref:uncharacterized protein LOC122505859 n=1 Tax=Leptopilina heterotoma TaxID=63436 RepID=UPI001CA95DA9|nr:uncharacterized protein LOC122505859 [Leptopilina heterotoma]